jgi:hypothetical protein
MTGTATHTNNVLSLSNDMIIHYLDYSYYLEIAQRQLNSYNMCYKNTNLAHDIII